MCRLRCNCDTVQQRVRNLLVARTKPLVTMAAITQPERRDVTSAVEWVCLQNLGTVLGSSNANYLFKYSCVRFYLETKTIPKSKQHPAASLEKAVPVPPHLPFRATMFGFSCIALLCSAFYICSRWCYWAGLWLLFLLQERERCWLSATATKNEMCPETSRPPRPSKGSYGYLVL